MEKIVLTSYEPGLNADSKELANIIIQRVGLTPRKQGSTDKMYRTLIELYERSKEANKLKNPELAVMTVDDMGYYAGITRQTMYEYLKRWMNLNIIIKTSFIKDAKVIIGYKLNGNTLEQAFEKACVRIQNNTEATMKYVKELQRIIKNEKIKSGTSRKMAEA